MKTIIIGIVLLIAAGAGGYLYYTGYFTGGAEESVAEDDGHGEEGHGTTANEVYLPLDPPFVVNFTHRGTLRYLQVSLEVMYGNQTAIDKVSQRMPAIRNALILLFSDQDYETLSTLEGKENLRHSILLAVNDVIEYEAEGTEDLGEVYITNFVMQ